MAKKKVPNSGSLEAELEAVEREVLPDITSDLADARSALVEAFNKLAADRIELGKAINSYRLHFKPRHSWLKAAEVLSGRLGRSKSTLYNLMHDAELDQKLTRVRRAELRAQGVEPAKPKYAPILEQLADGPEDESPADARHAVEAAIAQFKSRKSARDNTPREQASATPTLEEFANQEIERIVEFASQRDELTQEAIADALTSRIQAWARHSDGVAESTSAEDGAPIASQNPTVDAPVEPVDDHTPVQGDAAATEVATPATSKRPPLPASTQQPTLFDDPGQHIA